MLDTQLSILQKLQNRLLQKIEDRASDPAMQGVAGGATGLLVRREARVMENGVEKTFVKYELDSATIRKLLSIAERARVLEEASRCTPARLPRTQVVVH